MTNQTLWGADLPPTLFGCQRISSIFFFNRALVLDVECRSPGARPTTLKNFGPIKFLKINNIIVTISMSIQSVPGLCQQPKNRHYWCGLRIYCLLMGQYYVGNVHGKLDCPKGVPAA